MEGLIFGILRYVYSSCTGTRPFLYISKPSLHDCVMEHPNFTAAA